MDFSRFNYDIVKPKGWNRLDPNSSNIGSFSSNWTSPTTMKHIKISIESILLKIKCPCCTHFSRLQSSLVTHDGVEAIHLSYVCFNCKEEFTNGEIDTINIAQFNPGKKKQLVFNLIKEVFTNIKQKTNG